MASNTAADAHAKERQPAYRQSMGDPVPRGTLRIIKATQSVSGFAASAPALAGGTINLIDSRLVIRASPADLAQVGRQKYHSQQADRHDQDNQSSWVGAP